MIGIRRIRSVALSAGIAGLLSVAVLTVPTVLAATGYAQFDPQSAHVGDTVKAVVQDYNCDAFDAIVLPIRFVKPDGGKVVAKVDMQRAFPVGHTFVVPQMPPGEYYIEVECAPDDWLGVSIDGSEDVSTFTVLGGSPDTSTADPSAPPAPATWWVQAVLTAGITGGLLALARARIRPRSRRR